MGKSVFGDRRHGISHITLPAPFLCACHCQSDAASLPSLTRCHCIDQVDRFPCRTRSRSSKWSRLTGILHPSPHCAPISAFVTVTSPPSSIDSHTNRAEARLCCQRSTTHVAPHVEIIFSITRIGLAGTDFRVFGSRLNAGK